MEVKISNFNKKNTPPIVEKIGNILLVAGSIGAAVLIAPATIPTLELPPLIVQGASYLAALGAIGKAITKLFGKKDEPETNE